ENEFGKSDHDHLGKLVTYLSNFEARTGIWIVGDPRPEHVKAVTWLNEGAADVYLLKAEAIQIDGPPPALLLTRIVAPSIEAKQVGAQKQERAERHEYREEFWKELLPRAKEQTSLHSGVSPGTDSWLSAGSGRSGVHFTYLIRQDSAEVQL